MKYYRDNTFNCEFRQRAFTWGCITMVINKLVEEKNVPVRV